MFGVSNVTNRMDPNSIRSRLFVGNINTIHMQKQELEAIFQQYGQVIGLSVHRGYAFVQYSNEQSARAALNNEDGKVYFNMVLDVSLASGPKNRKRGRSYTGALLCDQSNLAELAFQSQAALAAIGGHFSQLGFLPQQQTLYQYRSPGIIGAPLLGSARTFHRTSPSNHASSTSQHKSRTSFASQSFDTAKTAKRTRLENPTSSTFPINKLSSVDIPNGEFFSLKSPISVDSASPTPKSKRLTFSRSSDSAISDKLSGMTVDNVLDLRSSSSEDEESSISQESFRNLETQLPSPTITTPVQTTQPKPSSSSNPNIEDILICGRCRRLFDTVDDLLSHKTKNYCVIGVKDGDSEHSCRCKELGEPESLGCLFCNKIFLSSWELLEHCRLEHNLIVYKVPKHFKPGSCSTSKRKIPIFKPISNKGDSRVKEKPSDSRKSLEKESKCHDELNDSVEIVESPETSNKEICISSDDEDADID